MVTIHEKEEMGNFFSSCIMGMLFSDTCVRSLAGGGEEKPCTPHAQMHMWEGLMG